MPGNIINGPVSPHFHDYEMMKAAEKTNVFRERPQESADQIRSRRKEWLIALVIIVVIGTVIVWLARAGGAKANVFKVDDIRQFTFRGTQYGTSVEQSETILNARLVNAGNNKYVVYDGAAPKLYKYGSFGGYLYLTFSKEERLQSVQLVFGQGKDPSNPKIDYGSFRNRPEEIEGLLANDLTRVLGEPAQKNLWVQENRQIEILTDPDYNYVTLEFRQN